MDYSIAGITLNSNNILTMKKIFTILLTSIMFATLASAADVVYLNNGKVVQGNLTKDDGINVVIESNGNTLTYKKIEVRKIEKASTVVVPETPKRAAYVDYSTKSNGWWCAVEVMGGGSVDVNYNPNFYNIGFSFINGYRFNQFIQIGLGVGFTYYITNKNSYYTECPAGSIYAERGNPIIEPKANNTNDDYYVPRYPDDINGKTYKGSPWSIPLFIDVRGNFITNDTRTVVPYWAFDLGFSFSANYLNGLKINDLRGDTYLYDYTDVKTTLGDGVFFAPTIGVKIGTPRHNLLIGITYTGQVMPRWGLQKNAVDGNAIEVGPRFTNFLCGKIGYEF